MVFSDHKRQCYRSLGHRTSYPQTIASGGKIRKIGTIQPLDIEKTAYLWGKSDSYGSRRPEKQALHNIATGSVGPAADGGPVMAAVTWPRESFRFKCRVAIKNPHT